METRNRCRECIWWVSGPEPKEKTADWVGECHRHAPKPNFLQIPIPQGAVGMKPPSMINMTQFPPTGENSFCGDFKPRTLRLAETEQN
jgi:hypothetical protein